jgi:hypothetical protein
VYPLDCDALWNNLHLWANKDLQSQRLALLHIPVYHLTGINALVKT